MKERIQMNSASLQEKFPEVYREFFSKCPIVVSAPGNFFWAGEYGAFFGGLAIKQKVPLRVYVGLEPISLPVFEMGEMLHFIPSHTCFERWPSSVIKKEGLISVLDGWLKSQKISQETGFRINVLSEFPPGCGLSSSGAGSVALAVAAFLYYNLLPYQKIIHWRQLPVCELPFDKDFDQVFRTAWKIESLYHAGFSSGASCFTSLTHSSYPILHFIEKKTENYPSLDFIDQKRYFAFRIDEFANLSSNSPFLDLKSIGEWPIDFGLIYSGDVGTTEGAIKSLEGIRWDLSDLASEWRKVIKKSKIPKDRILFSEIIRKPESEIINPYIKAISTISLEVLHGLSWVFTSGSSERALRYLLRAVNTNHKLLDSLNVSSLILDKICFLVNKKVRDLGDDFGAGCKLIEPGKKGDILFVVNYHGLRDRIFDLISELRKETKENIWLDYASWIDGIEEKGVKVEQHLAEGIYSKFISEGSISLKSWTGADVSQTEITSLEDFEKEKSKIDLLLDAIENDIYIRGEKLTSKEIPSSSTTVEILGILLDNLGKSISDSQLPESSYSQDRNEMQSKIISPLVRVLKKRTNKTLPLKISGGLVDFKIKLDPSDLDIRILNKIF